MGGRRRRPIRGVLAAAILLPLGIGACGGGRPQVISDPAAVVPVGAPVYVQATVQPRGRQRKTVERFLGRLPHGSRLTRELVARVDESLAESPQGGEDLSFAADVKPWLGSSIAFFTTVGGPDPPAGVVLTVADPGAAAAVTRAEPAQASGRISAVHLHRGVLYAVDGKGQTSAYMDGLLVAGDERAVRAAIDVERADRPSLAAAGGLRAVRRGQGPTRPLAVARLDLAALSGSVGLPGESLPVAIPAAPGSPVLAADTDAGAPATLRGTVTAALSLGAGRAAVELDTRLGRRLYDAAVPAVGGNPAKVIGRLPASAYVAVAAPRFGAQFAAGLRQGLQGELGPFADPRALRNGLRGQLGFDPIALARSLGDLGIFAAGSPHRGGGAAVLQITHRRPVIDAMRSLPLLFAQGAGARLVPLPAPVARTASGFAVRLPGTTDLIVVAIRGDRLIVALGAAAAAQALDPDRTLGETGAVRTARRTLGAGLQPALLVDVHALARAFRGDPGALAPALPYLRAVDLLTAGSRRRGRSVETRVVAALRPRGR